MRWIPSSSSQPLYCKGAFFAPNLQLTTQTCIFKSFILELDKLSLPRAQIIECLANPEALSSLSKCKATMFKARYQGRKGSKQRGIHDKLRLLESLLIWGPQNESSYLNIQRDLYEVGQHFDQEFVQNNGESIVFVHMGSMKTPSKRFIPNRTIKLSSS